jgi:hypothetical protein
MKALMVVAAIAVIAAGIGTGDAWAGDSKTFTISCTIPEIPGVNVPVAVEKIVPQQEQQATAPREPAAAQDELQVRQTEQDSTILMYTYVSR